MASILITGCSSGIGAHAARRLRDRGWHVVASARQEADCERLRGEGFDSVRLDYADPDSIAAAVDRTLAITGGRLDALFNNGAYALPGAVEDLPPDGLREIFEANLFGWHDLTRRVIPAMRAQGRGRIVNCSSVLGFTPLKWRGAYNATKYALEGLTRTLRMEMADTGIRVILIQPGPIDTKFRENSIPPFERWIDWQNSARADQYAAELKRRLYDSKGSTPFERPPEAVVRRLIHAVEAARPRAVYKVTVPTYALAGLRRILPWAVLERLLARG